MQNHTITNGIRIGILLAASSLLSTARADYASTVTSLAPVGYYRLGTTVPVPGNIASNSGTAGAIGNGFYVREDPLTPIHGVTNGALVATTNGAASFTAGSLPPFMQVPFDASINPKGAFTAEAWAQPSVAPGGLTCLFTFGHLENPAYAPNRSGWLLYQDNGASSGGHGWQYRMYNHVLINRSLTLSGGGVPVVGTWTHVAVSYDGTNGYLYVNGVLQASGPSPGYTPNVDGNFSIAARNDRAFQYNGLIDEVALYTNALSAATILAHYQNGTNASPSTPYETLVKSSNPLLYYRLDEPVFTPTVTPPTTPNLGSWGAAQDANLEDGLTVGQPGVPYPGFGAGNLAPHFNGLEGTVVINNPPLNTNILTFTAWVKRQGPTDGGSQGIYGNGWAAFLFQRGHGGSLTKATGFGFGDANDLRYHWEDTGSGWVPSPRMVIPDQVWCFVAAVYTPTQTVLCLNGVLATNVSAHTAHDFSGDPLYIGRDPVADLGDRVVHGFIDEVAIFDKALTASQLQQLFAAGAMPPVITSQPKGTGGQGYEGVNISFSVAAIGGLPLSYQWRKDGIDLSGETQPTFSKTNVLAGLSGNYEMVVSNPFASVTSSPVAVTIVASPPILTKTPASTSRFPGGTLVLSVAAEGSTPITFQWLKGVTPIPGETNTTLTINQLQASDAAAYSVVATNPRGVTPSLPATLSLLPVTPNAVAAILARGPIAFWRLNETSGNTAIDPVGGFDGTYLEATTHHGQVGPRPPAFLGLETTNNAYGFDGGTSDVTCPPLNVTLQTATILAFIQPLGLPPTDLNGLVYSRGSGGSATGLNLRPTTGNLGYNWNDVALTYNWDSLLTPLTNQWNLVALVVETNQATMYLDTGAGLQTAINTLDHGIHSFPAPTHLGNDPSGNRIFEGLMDGVAVFDHALSFLEIQIIRDAAYLNINPPLEPSIAVNPIGQTLVTCDSYTLSAQATGSQPLSYQWTKNGTNVPGAVRGTLAFPSIAASDAGTYRWLVTQGSTTVTSTPAILSVITIQIVVNPVGQTLFAGDSYTLSASVAGCQPLYQWTKNGTNVPGATQVSLAFPSIAVSNSGTYRLLATLGSTTVTSTPAILNVLPIPSAVNLTNQLVLHLRFDGNYSDSSGRTNDATAVGTPTSVPAGKLGAAVHLSNLNYLTVSDLNNDLQLDVTNSFSVALWLKFTSAFNDLPIIGNAVNSTYQKGWVLTEEAGRFEWTLTGNDVGQTIADPVGGPLINDGTWHNVVAVFDRSTGLAASYVDGQSVDIRSIADVGTLITGNTLTLAQDPTGIYGVAGAFDLDDLGIWRRALTPVEARSIYYAGQSGNSFDTVAPSVVTMTVVKSGGNVQFQWSTGTLQASATVSGGYTNVVGAAPPSYTVPATGKGFYRVRVQ